MNQERSSSERCPLLFFEIAARRAEIADSALSKSSIRANIKCFLSPLGLYSATIGKGSSFVIKLPISSPRIIN